MAIRSVAGKKVGVIRGPGLKYKAKPKPMRRGTVKSSAVRHVIKRQASKGHHLTTSQARTRVKHMIRKDRNGGAFKYDFAGDGAYKKDKDYHTAKGRAYLKRHPTDSMKAKAKKVKKAPASKPQTPSSDAGSAQSSDNYGGPQSPPHVATTSSKKKKKK